jgi:hypothetical protein
MPKSNPIKPNLFGFAQRGRSVSASESLIPAAGRFHTFALYLFTFTFFTSVSSVEFYASGTVVSKFKNHKTNPISKSLTHYIKRTNPKITRKKQTQTNPIVDNFQRSRRFQFRGHLARP